MKHLDSNLTDDQVLSKKVVLKITRLSASIKVLHELQIEYDNTSTESPGFSIDKTPTELMEAASLKVNPISSVATSRLIII